ncbi:MAG TPA: FAD-dependent monooxygenase [Chloroflexota bacterium]|nr:FAD-dependent monooxygenase [Chloroflexota bacterium]
MSSPKRAIVIGGSMAGLLAARVLVDHFSEVVLVERDRLPAEAEFRAGVPQSRHLHVLLRRGAQLLEQFFPGISADLVSAGAEILSWPRDLLWLGPGGWGQRFDLDFTLICSRRELVEWSVRRRVLASERLRVVQEHDVTALMSTPDGGAVRGVRLHARGDADPASAHELEAALVVDASGRGSRAPEWLQALGYPAPRQTVVNPFLGYASRQYEPPPGFHADWRALFLQARAPQTTRAGGLFPIEGGRWIVTLAGIGGDYPPTDDEGFLEFARSLRTPILYEAIKNARPLTPIAGYRRTENRLRHYDELQRWPDRLVVLGDAACALNPIYGQGMSVAAETALVLDDWVRRAEAPLAFQRRLARSITTPWLLATAEDYRYSTTEGGQRDLTTRLMHRYFDQLTRVALVDPVVQRAFLGVIHLLAAPKVLFQPHIVARTLRGPGGRRLSQPPTLTPLADSVPAAVI